MTPKPHHHDLLIRHGTVIDGSKQPRFDADVAVRHGRISAIGALHAHSAEREIDATGLIVAPGFIDAHTHDDQALLTQPDMSFKVSQGVTTVITGNCGISAAPLRDDVPLVPPLDLVQSRGLPRFGSFAAYLQALRDHPAAVNVAALVGHSTLRAMSMSALDRVATREEIARMQAQVREALQAGAVGLSTGTFYPPAAAASTEELIAVAAPLRELGGVYATHMRNEADEVMASLEETFRIGRETGAPVVISHHKVSHPRNHGRSLQTLPFIREAMQHQCVSLDCYPYAAGSTMIHTDPAMLQGRVQIASSQPHPECAGRDLDDIAREWGVGKPEAALRLRPGSAIYFMMDEADVQRIMAFDHTMIGSDGIPLGDKPHPRLWGTFPRVLGHYCRDLGLFPLETAVWKMSGRTAECFGLPERGRVAVGHHADLVLFDAATVKDTASYSEPCQPAAGIAHVIVNGVPTWVAGQHTGARSGAVLRRQASEATPTSPLST